MKKTITFLLVLVFTLAPITALADSVEQKTTLSSPISVERNNINGNEYLIKTYEVGEEAQPSSLEENDFELDGFLFAHETTEKSINEKEDKKEVVEEVKIESQTNNFEDILKQLPSVKEYNKDGYSGTIVLNTGSIITEVSGYTTKSYTVSTTKEYPGLMYADPSYVAQTAIKNGYTLPLTDVNWVVMGTGLAGDSLVPTEYKATATYSKVFSSQVPTGYISTARYEGIVAKIEVDTITYTVTYVGRAADNDGFPLVLKVITCVVAIALLAGSVFIIIFLMKSRYSAEIFNHDGEQLVYIGKQVVDIKKPNIDLNEFEDMIQSYSFKIALNEKTAWKLFGRNVGVALRDVTKVHSVKDRNGEYRFDIDFGGRLDVE